MQGSGPKCDSDGHLALPRRPARKQHCGQVRARDEQYQKHCTDQDEQRRPHSCDRQFFQRKHITAETFVLRIVIRMLTPHLPVDRCDLRLRLDCGNSRLQPTDNKITARIPGLQLFIREYQRLPNIGASTKLPACSEIEQLKWKIESLRHDADDGEALSIQEQLCANDSRIAVEFPPPETLADDGNIIPARLALVGFKKAPLHRCHSKQRKYSRGDNCARDTLRLISVRQ